MAKEKNNLADKLLKNSSSIHADLLSSSKFFEEGENTPTDVPILNIALTGKLDEGMSSGILTIAGQSKRFKTLFGLYLISAYQKKHKDSVCIFYDSEFGTPPDYLSKFGLDLSRIIHVPVKCVEDLRHDMTKQLDMLTNDSDKKNNKVMIFIDSLGNLASRKELDDALEGKEKTDMTRAKIIKSLFRIIRLDIKMLDIPLVIINHTYKDQGAANPKYAGEVVGGGCVVKGTKVIMADGFFKNIEDIKCGDSVKTLSGSKIVENIWNPETLLDGSPECLEIEFDDGYKVICSKKHKFLVEKNDKFIWKCASKLKETDNIISSI